jgi:hypothetical protein
MIKCPNGCQVVPDALLHNCKRHEQAIRDGRPFKCNIKNCKLEDTLKQSQKEE